MEQRLAEAKIKESSLARYRASVHRCAQLVAAGHGSETLGFVTGIALVEAFGEPQPGKKPLRPATIANYLEGLIMLGKHGGAQEDALAGLRFLVEDLRENARACGKVKYPRLAKITEAGGFAFIAGRIGEMRQEAEALPDHASEKLQLLQAAALCAVSMNKPGRTGDVSRWCLGEELVRESDGTWVLAWKQGKSGYDTEAGKLWPEVSEILDALILGGRPDRFVHLRYHALLGMNWLTLGPRAMSDKWPSSVVKTAIGVPLHDLRTLAADFMRRHDPVRAADVISTHLGHRTSRAGDAYRSESEGEAAAKAWAEMRQQIAKG
ncbi:hypothetical protein FIU97_19370 (plasmid) [Roseivivax sp. THAF40]|nr:hypothetical protein FIV09_18585 [Roseivivax sp. THAF197b]QFT48756.1 hypothetical protein FIU97_19370 [Roseivivax sp. THAF40]